MIVYTYRKPYGFYQKMSFSPWPLSCSTMPSRFICVATNGRISLLWLNSIPFKYLLCFLHPVVLWWILSVSIFWLLWGMWQWIYRADFVSFRYIPRSAIAVSRGSSGFNFFKKCVFWLPWVFTVALRLSLVVVHGLSGPEACGIFVPRPGSKPRPLRWRVDSSPPGHQGRPWFYIFEKPSHCFP